MTTADIYVTVHLGCTSEDPDKYNEIMNYVQADVDDAVRNLVSMFEDLVYFDVEVSG